MKNGVPIFGIIPRSNHFMSFHSYQNYLWNNTVNRRPEVYYTETFSKDLVFTGATATYIEEDDVNNNNVHDMAISTLNIKLMKRTRNFQQHAILKFVGWATKSEGPTERSLFFPGMSTVGQFL